MLILDDSKNTLFETIIFVATSSAKLLLDSTVLYLFFINMIFFIERK